MHIELYLCNCNCFALVKIKESQQDIPSFQNEGCAWGFCSTGHILKSAIGFSKLNIYDKYHCVKATLKLH